MNAAQIKEGFEYAVSTSPRKGVAESALHTVSANRVIARNKGVERWAENSKDRWGDVVGAMKRDGIRGEACDRVTGEPLGNTYIYKARDFLMPWSEYDFRRKADEAEADRRRAEREAIREAKEARHAAALVKLREVEGITILENNELFYESTPENPWHIYVQQYDFRISSEGVQFLLGRVSELVYEVLAGQDS